MQELSYTVECYPEKVLPLSDRSPGEISMGVEHLEGQEAGSFQKDSSHQTLDFGLKTLSSARPSSGVHGSRDI